MDEAGRQRQFEERFHRELRTRAARLLRRPLPADRVEVEALPDGMDGVRATLNRLERYERGLLDTLPGTRAVQLRFRRRVFGPLRRTVARLRAQVLVPLEALLNGEAPGPVGREQVLDALARYELLPQRERPTAVVFASPTGFTPAARALVQEYAERALILMGGREDGGWDVDLPAGLRGSAWASLFEFESQDDRLRRLMYHLERNALRLESQGLPVSELAEQLGLSPEQTEALVRRACRTDARLLTVVHEGQVHVCRSPLGDEGGTMSIWSRIRRLLGFQPTTAERVRAMTAQRIMLEQQRREVDQKIAALEAEERQALQEGAAAVSTAEKRQIAARLMRVRRDLRRARAQASVYTQQIDILGTHIHNLTLAEQGRRAELPKAEELTRQAAEAEQVVNELAANADLAAGIEVGAQTPMQAEEEEAILAEFAEVAEAQARSGVTPTAEEERAASGQEVGRPESAASEKPTRAKGDEAAEPS